MSIDQSHRTLRGLLLGSLLFLAAAPAGATPYFDLGLHGRVQVSDIVVLGRVVDPALALVSVERVFKGEAPGCGRFGRPKIESRCPLRILCSVRGMQRVWWPTPS
jgi:hypothetical protein